MSNSLKDDEKILSPAFLEEIKRIRKERGISVEEIAEKTNIKVAHIRAIEDGDLNRLPGGPYNRAFIRSISEYLGIDTKPYERKAEPNEFIKERQVKLELGRPNASMPSKVTIIGCLFVIFVFYSMFYGPRASKKEKIDNAIETYHEQLTEKAEEKIELAKTEEEKDIIKTELQAKITDETGLLQQISQTSPIKVSPIKTETESYVDKELVITLLALNNVKVAVKDVYGKVLLNRELEKSEAIMLNGAEQYFMATSNINNLEIYLDGVQIRDTSKIQKQGSTFIFRTEGMVGIAESQPIASQITTTIAQPTAAGNEVKPATNEPVEKAVIKNEDQPQNNTQGTGR